jgi:hypothetical protein
MCYSKDLSLASFIFGITSGILLIKFGSIESKKTNITIASFFIFVSLMQLIEYLMWSDLKCESGLNKTASIFGPLLNHLQPLMLLIFCFIYLRSNNLISENLLMFTNLTYLIYMGCAYLNFIQTPNNLCTQTNQEGHLSWKWNNNFNYIFYHLLVLINIINYSSNKNLVISLVVSYIMFIISYLKFNNNIGEFWCLMVTGIPLVNLGIQKILNINN